MNTNTRFFVSALAHRISSTIAQRAYINANRDNVYGILKNVNLDKTLWLELFDGAKVDNAVALAQLPLDEEQSLLCAKDKRKTVKHTLLRNKNATFSKSVVDNILKSKWFTQEYAHTWLKANLVPKRNIKKVAKIENGIQAILSFVDTDLYTSAEVVERLHEVRIINQKIVPYLLDLRKDLVPLLVESERSQLVHAISSSQWLTDVSDIERIFYRLKSKLAPMSQYTMCERETLGNLIANPNTPLTLAKSIYDFMESHGKIVGISRWDTSKMVFNDRLLLFPGVEYLTRGDWANCEDEKIRKFALKCAASADYNKYPTLKNLLLKEHFNIQSNVVVPSKSEITPLDLAETLIHDRGFTPQMLTPEVVTQVENELDSYGVIGWELFWFLLQSYEGNLANLIVETKALHKE